MDHAVIASIRQVSLLAAGSAAGVLGLTNFTGFGFFLVAQLAISLSIISLAASGKPSTYLLDPASVNWDAMRVKVNASANLVKGLAAAPPGPATQVWAWAKFILLDGLVDNFLSYVLWWTFWSAIVHVYD